MGNKISAFIGNTVVCLKSSRFPLLKLPSDAINNVILTMDPADLITFSLCTNSTKRRVASLQLKELRLTLKIDQYIVVEICWPDDTIVQVFLLDANSEKWVDSDNKITEFSGPNNAVASFGPADNVNGGLLHAGCREWNKEKYETRDWLEHFKEVLDANFKHVIFLPNSERYDTPLLENTIGDFSFITVSISPECTNAHVQDLHKQLHSSENMCLARNPYDASADFQRFLNRNFDSFGFESMLNPTLEDLLVSNAAHICMHSTLSGRVINRFLKLWVKGGNRQMLRLIMYFNFEERLEMTEVLKGIEHKPVERRQNYWMLKRRNASIGGLHTKIVNGFEELIIFTIED